MAVILVLLKRIAQFIVVIAVAFKKEIQNNKSPPHRVSILKPLLVEPGNPSGYDFFKYIPSIMHILTCLLLSSFKSLCVPINLKIS